MCGYHERKQTCLEVLLVAGAGCCQQWYGAQASQWFHDGHNGDTVPVTMIRLFSPQRCSYTDGMLRGACAGDVCGSLCNCHVWESPAVGGTNLSLNI